MSCRSRDGRLFHISGSTAATLLSPKVLCVRGKNTCSVDSWSDKAAAAVDDEADVISQVLVPTCWSGFWRLAYLAACRGHHRCLPFYLVLQPSSGIHVLFIRVFLISLFPDFPISHFFTEYIIALAETLDTRLRSLGVTLDFTIKKLNHCWWSSP